MMTNKKIPCWWLSTPAPLVIKEEKDPLELSPSPTRKRKEMPALIPLKRVRLEEERGPSTVRGVESQSLDRDSSRENGTGPKGLENHPQAGSPKGGSRARPEPLPKGRRYHPMKPVEAKTLQDLIEGTRPFWDTDEGVMFCPFCFGNLNAQRAGYARIPYNRDTFRRHWESSHYRSYTTADPFPPAQRISYSLGGHTLYILILGSKGRGEGPAENRSHP